MTQSRQMTLIEALLGTVVSLVLGISINMVVLPLLGYPIKLVESAGLVAIFMVVSLARSYVLRRIFATLRDPWLTRS